MILVSHSVRGDKGVKDPGISPALLVNTAPEEAWIANHYPGNAGSSRRQRIKSKFTKRFHRASASSMNNETNTPQMLHKCVGSRSQAAGFKKSPRSETIARKGNDDAIAPTKTPDQLFITPKVKSLPEAENISIFNMANSLKASGDNAATCAHCSRMEPTHGVRSISTAEVNKAPVLSNSTTSGAIAEASACAPPDVVSPTDHKGRFRHDKRSRRARSIDSLEQSINERPSKRHHFRRWLNAKSSAVTAHIDSTRQNVGVAAVETAPRSIVSSTARVALKDGDVAAKSYTHPATALILKRDHDEVVNSTMQTDISSPPSKVQKSVEACPHEGTQDSNKVDELSFRTKAVYGTMSSGGSGDMESCLQEDSSDDVDSGLTLAAHSKIPKLMSQLESLMPKSALLESLILNNELVGAREPAASSPRESVPPASPSQSEEKSEDHAVTINLPPTAKSLMSKSLFAESFDNAQGHSGAFLQIKDLDLMTEINSGCEIDTDDTDHTETPATKSSTAMPNFWGFFGGATKTDSIREVGSKSIPVASRSSLWKSFGKQPGVAKEEDHRMIPMPKNTVSPFGDDKIGYAF